MGRDVEVTVYFDRQLDLKATKTLRHGSTVADLKAALADEDPTGEASPEDFVLAPVPAGDLGTCKPLQDSALVTEALAELVVCKPDEPVDACQKDESSEDEQRRLKAVYEAQIEQLRALGVKNLPLPPPDLDESGGGVPAGGAGEDMAQQLALQRILDEQNAEDACAEPAALARPLWRVIGGGDRGGIIVREGLDLVSAQLSTRLATGSEVEELQLAGERLRFQRVTGDGPETGWVSTCLKGKDLLIRVDEDMPARAGPAACSSRWWPDLDGQSVGPWHAHADRVTTVMFDRFHRPPKESRRLYTGSWMEAKVCCWELSRGGPGERAPPPPRPLGGLSTGGLISGLAAISPACLLAAVSANPPPETGSVCHQADFKQRLAEQDDQLGPGDTLVAWNPCLAPFRGPTAAADAGPAVAPGRIQLHERGCHSLSVWPTPTDDCYQESCSRPQLVASISVDMLAVSRVADDELGLAPASWMAKFPHGAQGEARHVCWAGVENLWSSDKSGVLKLWDVSRRDAKAISEVNLSVHSFAHVVLQQAAGLLMAAHEDGIAFFDVRTCKMVRTMFTKEPAKVLSVLPGEHASLFAGIGSKLVQYDMRAIVAGSTDSKSKTVGMWTLASKVFALDCMKNSAGNTLVAVGCQDGSAAAFDAS